MEILVDIREDLATALDEITGQRKIKMSEALETAITEYVKKYRIQKIKYDLFGSWKDNNSVKSGGDYQRDIRKEWIHRRDYLNWGAEDDGKK